MRIGSTVLQYVQKRIRDLKFGLITTLSGLLFAWLAAAAFGQQKPSNRHGTTEPASFGAALRKVISASAPDDGFRSLVGPRRRRPSQPLEILEDRGYPSYYPKVGLTNLSCIIIDFDPSRKDGEEIRPSAKLAYECAVPYRADYSKMEKVYMSMINRVEIITKLPHKELTSTYFSAETETAPHSLRRFLWAAWPALT